jgi:primosomal protein N' (replication factor Y)
LTYAEVIVPLPLNPRFTYAIPDDLQGKVVIGARVIVPFGKRKSYTAIVTGLTPLAPEGYEVKPIEQLLDPPGEPIVRHPQLKFWEWISEYYLCPVGDVMRAALPAGLKVESETFVELAPDFDISEITDDEEALVCQALDHHGRLMAADLEKKSGTQRSLEGILSRLIERGVVVISEKIVERYRTLKQTMVRLPEAAADLPEWRVQAFQTVKGAKKQEQLLLAMLQLSANGAKAVLKSELLERSGCSSAILAVLREKRLVEVFTKSVNRFRPELPTEPVKLPTLSKAQQEACDGVVRLWGQEQKNVVLLRGVTSSGKTEIYIRLIDMALREGGQTLYLVPEIALTTQLTERLQRVFGSRVIVYHSKFTDNERVDIYRRLLKQTSPCVVIGARSALFLPFQHLRMVIVDEEHEPSYKQFDPAPRYNARDCAIVLASMHGAKTLLGSASPSIETYYKALKGQFGLVELTERYGGVVLPEIEVVDMNREFKITGGFSMLARDTTAQVKSALAAGNQAIIFHNRRGFAPMARCKQCAHVPKCMNCDVSLTYHKRENKLVCHYCGATYPLPTICPVCQEPAIQVVGYGTERVEDDVQRAFRDAKILRMDLDTTRNKDGYQEIINNFSARKAQILVGTQMVTKGLDFDGVNVVGILSADALINYPDFRSSERAFNMMLQVAGRAGRRDTPGKVIIQTTQPEHSVVKFVKTHDYLGFYNYEIAERKAHFYPPFTRLINIYLKHRDNGQLCLIAETYGRRLRELLGNRVFGPEEPVVSRVQSLYIRKIMLKVEVDVSMKAVKELLRKLFEDMHSMPMMRGSQVYYDVDPW